MSDVGVRVADSDPFTQSFPYEKVGVRVDFRL